MSRRPRILSLREQSVDSQAKIAVVLLALIPALTCMYLGGVIGSEGPDTIPLYALAVILVCTGTAAASGYLILRKYAMSILKLRRYVDTIAHGTLTEEIHLVKSANCDDLQSIEDNLNRILREMQRRMKLIEEKLQVECGLRKTLQDQHQVILKAERQRVMLQSIGAACHHLGQPATALRMRLYLMRKKVRSVEELIEIDASIQDVEAIEAILTKLRDVNEYRTEPYLVSGDVDGSHILAI